MDETPLIQQYLQLRSEFMGYLYAMTRDVELAEDIYPTLASLTGCEPPENQLEGNDLSALMTDPEAEWNEATVTTFGYKNYGVRSERYRHIVYADGSEELYDHTNDKWEWHNIADRPEYDEVKQILRKELPTHHQPNGVTYKPPPRQFNAR